MELYHIVATSAGGVIGKENRLPWHFPADLKHFKQLTMNSTVIMGRNTFESIGKPLPDRENFVLSRSHSVTVSAENVKFFDSVDEALINVKTPKAFIIGGASLYKQTLNQIDGIWQTQIEGKYEGDAYYPEIPPFFREKKREILQQNPKLEVVYYENTQRRTG